MNWNDISKEQNLSLSFIEEHQKELKWDVVSSHITITKDFLSTFRKQINWKKIVRNPSFSPSLVEYVSDYEEMEWKVFSLHYPLTIDLCKKIEKKIQAMYLKNNKVAKIIVITYQAGKNKTYEYRESEITRPKHFRMYTDRNGRTQLEYEKIDETQHAMYDSYASSNHASHSYSSTTYEDKSYYFGGF